jgi:ribosome maturation factor RimP
MPVFVFTPERRDHKMNAQMNSKPQPVVGGAANPLVNRVWQLAEPVCLGEGLDLLFVEFQREPGGRTLRLYLDKPGGITLADCTAISRQLGDLLDVGLETDLPYRLEVSSPGPQRPLARPADFERHAGRKVKIRTNRSIDGQKNFTGTLDKIGDGFVHIATRDKPVSIAFDEITKAQLIEDDDARPGGGMGRGGPKRPK